MNDGDGSIDDPSKQEQDEDDDGQTDGAKRRAGSCGHRSFQDRHIVPLAPDLVNDDFVR